MKEAQGSGIKEEEACKGTVTRITVTGATRCSLPTARTAMPPCPCHASLPCLPAMPPEPGRQARASTSLSPNGVAAGQQPGNERVALGVKVGQAARALQSGRRGRGGGSHRVIEMEEHTRRAEWQQLAPLPRGIRVQAPFCRCAPQQHA